MFPNRYPGNCDKCGNLVAAGAGFAVKLWGRNAPRVAMRDGSGRSRRVGKRNASGQVVCWHVRCAKCAGNFPPDAGKIAQETQV